MSKRNVKEFELGQDLDPRYLQTLEECCIRRSPSHPSQHYLTHNQTTHVAYNNFFLFQALAAQKTPVNLSEIMFVPNHYPRAYFGIVIDEIRGALFLGTATYDDRMAFKMGDLVLKKVVLEQFSISFSLPKSDGRCEIKITKGAKKKLTVDLDFSPVLAIAFMISPFDGKLLLYRMMENNDENSPTGSVYSAQIDCLIQTRKSFKSVSCAPVTLDFGGKPFSGRFVFKRTKSGGHQLLALFAFNPSHLTITPEKCAADFDVPVDSYPAKTQRFYLKKDPDFGLLSSKRLEMDIWAVDILKKLSLDPEAVSRFEIICWLFKGYLAVLLCKDGTSYVLLIRICGRRFEIAASDPRCPLPNRPRIELSGNHLIFIGQTDGVQSVRALDLTLKKDAAKFKFYRNCAKCGVQEGCKKKNREEKRVSQFQICRICKKLGLHKMFKEFPCHYCSFECVKNDWVKHKKMHCNL